MTAPRLLPSQDLRRVAWALELVYAGRTFRFATRALDVATRRGDVHHFRSGLASPDVESRLEIVDDQVGQLRVAVRDLPLDVLPWEARGHRIARATAEVCLLVEGELYERRVVVVRGQVGSPQWGAAGEGLTFTVDQAQFEDRGILPPLRAELTRASWPTAPAKDRGKPIPIVFGDFAGDDDVEGFSPTLWSGSNQRIVALYAQAGQDVELWGEQSDNVASATVARLTSSTGLVAYGVSISGLGFSSGERIWVRSWEAGQGALQAPDGGPLTTAGELIEWILRATSIPVDWGRVAAAKVLLEPYKVAGYIDSTVSPRDYLQRVVAPLLPISLLNGPDGYYPLVWRWDARREDAVERLEVGRNVHRLGGVTDDNATSANQVTVRFAPGGGKDDYTRSVTLTGEDTADLEDESWRPHPIARAALQEAGGVVEAREIKADIVFDAATAGLIAADHLRLHGLPRRRVSLIGELVDLAWLDLGDVVLVTDVDLQMVDSLGIVTAKAIRLEAVEIEVTFIRRPWEKLDFTAEPFEAPPEPTFLQLLLASSDLLDAHIANPLDVGAVAATEEALRDVGPDGEPSILAIGVAGEVLATSDHGTELFQTYSTLPGQTSLAEDWAIGDDPGVDARTYMLIVRPPPDFLAGASALRWTLSVRDDSDLEVASAQVDDATAVDGTTWILVVRMGVSSASLSVTTAGNAHGDIGTDSVATSGELRFELGAEAVGGTDSADAWEVSLRARWATDKDVSAIVSAFEL